MLPWILEDQALGCSRN